MSSRIENISKQAISNSQIQEKTRNSELPKPLKTFQFKTLGLDNTSFIKPNILVNKKNQPFHITTTQVGTNKFGLVVGNNKVFSESDTFLRSQKEEENENNLFFDQYGQSIGKNTQNNQQNTQQNTYRDSNRSFQASRQSQQKIRKTGNTLSRVNLNISQKNHQGFDIVIEGSCRRSSVFDNNQVEQSQQKNQRYMIQKISESSGSLNRKFSFDQLVSKINASEYGQSVLPSGLTQDYQKLKAFELSAIHKKNGMSPQVLYQQYLTQKKPQKDQQLQTMKKSNSHAVFKKVQDENTEEEKVSVDFSQLGVSIKFEKRPSNLKIATAKQKLVLILNDANNKRHQFSMNQYKSSQTEDPFSNSVSHEDHLLNFKVRLSSRESLPKQGSKNNIIRIKSKQRDSIHENVYKGNLQEFNQLGKKRKTISQKYSNIDPQRSSGDENFKKITNQSVEFSQSQDSKLDLLPTLVKHSEGKSSK